MSKNGEKKLTFRREREMRPLVERWLIDRGYFALFEWPLQPGSPCDVVGVMFGNRTGRRIPQMKSVVAIELKLHDVAGVLNQAHDNQLAAHESYAAMPADRVGQMRDTTKRRFAALNVGLLAVDSGVTIVIPSHDKLRKALWRKVRREAGGQKILEAEYRI